MGCNGGWLWNAWKYMENQGVVSDECYPYSSGAGATGTCHVDKTTTVCPSKTGTYKKYFVKAGSTV